MKSIFKEDNHLFVGLSGAEKDTIYDLHGSIWQSDNDGTSWTEITGDMTSTNIYGNNIIESNGHELILATYGGGLYKSAGLELSVGISEYVLENEIYPNPCEQSLELLSSKFFLKDEYKIYDINGKLIAEGIYEGEKINVKGFKKGEYILKISSQIFRFVKI